MTEVDLLRAMLSSPTSVALMVTDPNGLLLSHNLAAERLFGIAAPMQGSDCSAMFLCDGCSIDELQKEMHAALAQGECKVTRRYHLPGMAAPRWIDSRLTPVLDGEQRHLGFIRFAHDVTQQQLREQVMQRDAHTDSVTGLSNRHAFNERLLEAAAEHARSGDLLALHLIDLDMFKQVNDTLGHAAGDQVLRIAGERIRAATRTGDTVARLGGDEFAVLQTGAESPVDAAVLARKLVDALRQPMGVDGRDVLISASIGIAIAPQDGWSPDELLRKADVALYRVKHDGRNSYAYFAPELDEEARTFGRDVAAVREAVLGKQFHLLYQPIVSADSGQIRSLEALLRCDHPALSERPIPQVLDVIRKCGLIGEMSEWIVRQTCRDMLEFALPGVSRPVSVNLCARELSDFQVVALIDEAMAVCGLGPQDIAIELTEHGLFESAEVGRSVIDALSRRGLSIALDDFGTGFSSLSQLTQLPINVIKLDISFVQPLPGDADMCNLVSALIGLAHKLGMTVVAEGVESAAQADFLTAQHCDALQGFYFSQPLSVAQMRLI